MNFAVQWITILFLNLFFSQICFANLSDLSLQLKSYVTATHTPITYQMANEILFTKLDNHDGEICSVYSPNECIISMVVPSPKVMNIEHTWPQSAGANGDAKSDLHHLFVTSSSTNAIRSSLPFCNVKVTKWENAHSKRGYNEFNEHCFEVPNHHKGNVARAIFYFAIRYSQSIDEHQEYFLRQWHKEDPVDLEERERNQAIQAFQKNLNPFIENPELVDQINKF